MKRILILRASMASMALLFAVPTIRAADETVPSTIDSNSTFSESNKSVKRANWQEHLTLGPGDVLNISMLEAPDSARESIVIGPDGRVTYLQAEDVVAAGLTVDELRSRMDEALGKFYRMPHSIVIPAAYNSKKYYVLGAVTGKGVFPLNRPTTVIEAVARAGGLETGVFYQNSTYGANDQRTVELADLTRSFLVRNGQRVNVDFERLFERGDLSQNVQLEPDDYLYFASSGGNVIYVLGEVASPGVLAFAPQATVMSAIADRGGYTERAFKSRVLVVRGSLNHPETFVIDTAAILAAKAPNFKLEPKDIVYVSVNPWTRAIDVLDLAAQAFVKAFTVGVANNNVGPWIANPLIK